MALGNTPRRETNFTVEMNKSFSFSIWFKAADDTPVDLSNAELRFVAGEMAHRGGNEVLVATAVMTDLPGMMQFDFQAEDLAIDPGSYAYDVTLIPESGYSTPILKGVFEVGTNTDEYVENVYTSEVSTGSDITVYLNEHDVVEVTVERVDGLFVLTQELISDFRDEIAAAQVTLAASADAAAESAQQAFTSADELRHWFNTVGFPFWKGSQAQYDAIPVKNPDVLYLITA